MAIIHTTYINYKRKKKAGKNSLHHYYIIIFVSILFCFMIALRKSCDGVEPLPVFGVPTIWVELNWLPHFQSVPFYNNVRYLCFQPSNRVDAPSTPYIFILSFHLSKQNPIVVYSILFLSHTLPNLGKYINVSFEYFTSKYKCQFCIFPH